MTRDNADGWSLGAVGVVVGLTLAHLLGVASALEAPERLLQVHDVAGWAGSLLGLIGTLAAARAFSRGDYLRTVWATFAGAAFMLVLGTALRSYWLHAAPGRSFFDSPLLPYRMVIVVSANVLTTVALLLLGGTYRRSGLKPPVTWRSRSLVVLGGLVALAIALPQLLQDWKRLGLSAADTYSSITSLASTVSDFATILLVVPLLRVAYLMRGGRLAGVWWAMGLCGLVWLVYDARSWLAVALPGDDLHNLELLKVLRSPGLALVGLSGWLQREALVPTASHPPQPSPGTAGMA